MNVNLLDTEKAAKNVENTKKKPDYNPYEEEEVDEFGNVRWPPFIPAALSCTCSVCVCVCVCVHVKCVWYMCVYCVRLLVSLQCMCTVCTILLHCRVCVYCVPSCFTAVCVLCVPSCFTAVCVSTVVPY